MHPRRIAVAATLAITGALATPSLANSDHAHRELPRSEPRRGLIYDALERATGGRCAGLLRSKATGKCTHGPDPAPAGEDLTAAEPEPVLFEPGEVPRVQCVGDGQSGNRVQVIYARYSDRPDRYETFVDSIRQWAADADGVFSDSAAETGGERHIRFVHDAGCRVDVAHEVLPAGSSWQGELAQHGHHRRDRIYLVFLEDSPYCGIAWDVTGDDSDSPANRNNVGPRFAEVGPGCWGGQIAAHELVHHFGGVALSAPHSTGGFHCTDEYDLLCYRDFPNFPSLSYLCTDASHDRLLDCNHDDYFHTSPPLGSYLDTHWNVADSRFLVAPQQAAASPARVALQAPAGGTSAPRTVTLSNIGSGPLSVREARIEGAGAGEFSLGADGCTGATLAPGEQCAVDVTFTPAADGTRTAILSFTDDAADSPQIVELSGTGPAPAVAVSSTTLEFAEPVGQTSTPRTVTLSSTGLAPLTVSEVRPHYNAGIAIPTDGCSGRTLAPGEQCSVEVTFTPSVAGLQGGALLFVHDAAGGPATEVIVRGAGTGPRVVLSPGNVRDFAPQAIGRTSVRQPVTLSSAGTSALTLGDVRIAGANAADFALAADDCSGRTLAPGEACKVELTFTPSATGNRSGTLSFSDDAYNSPQILPLFGRGVEPKAAVSSSTVAFGLQRVGQSSASRTVTLSSTGSGALTVGEVRLGGANADDYAIAADGCGGRTLSVGASCTVEVRFTPPEVGFRNASLSFTDDAADSPQTVALSGEGTAPRAVLSSSVDFGDLTVGRTSGRRTVSLSNAGTAPLVVDDVQLGGEDAGNFAIAADGCNGTTVAPSGYCTVDVTFTPSELGPFNATLSFVDDAADSPQSVALSGTGTQVADLAVRLSATPSPVKSGGTLTYTLAVSNSGPDTASGLVLTDALPAGTQFASVAVPPGWLCGTPPIGETGSLSCRRASLAAGAADTLQLSVTVAASGKTTITNVATVAARSSDPAPANNEATVATAVQGRR